MGDLKFDHHTLVRVKENFITVSRGEDGQDMFAISGDGTKIAQAMIRQYRVDGRVAFVIDAVMDEVRRTEKIEKGSYLRDFVLGLLLLIFIVAVWLGVSESIKRNELFHHQRKAETIEQDSATKRQS